MPLVGLNNDVITESRVAADSAPLEFSSQAAVSVKDAPPPTNCWKRVFSSTVMPVPVPAPKVTVDPRYSATFTAFVASA